MMGAPLRGAASGGSWRAAQTRSKDGRTPERFCLLYQAVHGFSAAPQRPLKELQFDGALAHQSHWSLSVCCSVACCSFVR